MAPEETFISFQGSRMFRAASKPGLAFVCWTRATTWEKVVFQNLPPIEHFLAVRMQSDFKARTVFEAEADKLHDELLLRHGITESAHIADHQEHLKRVIKARDGRAATQAEVDDVASMLGTQLWNFTVALVCVFEKLIGRQWVQSEFNKRSIRSLRNQ